MTVKIISAISERDYPPEFGSYECEESNSNLMY